MTQIIEETVKRIRLEPEREHHVSDSGKFLTIFVGFCIFAVVVAIVLI